MARGLCAASVFLLTACPDKGGESATDTETTGTPPTTTEPTTTTMATTTATATEPTTTDATTTATATGEPTTSATTGEPATCEADAADLETSCAQLCEERSFCNQVDVAACTANCVQNAFKPTPACTCGAIAYNDCLTGLGCEGLGEATGAADAPCFEESASYLIGCGDCLVVPEFIMAEQCVTVVECPDVLGVSFVCNGGTCSCNDGMTDYKTCPDPGLCAGMDPAALNAAATACCGVQF